MLRNEYIKCLINRGYVVLNPVKSEEKCATEEVAALLNSFSSLGYTLNKEGVALLCELDSLSLANFYKIYFNVLKDISGVSKSHQVFYPCFPEVSKFSNEEMYVRAILHYLTVEEDDQGFMNQDLNDFPRINVSSSKKEVLKVINEEDAIKVLVDLTSDAFEGKVAIPYSSLELARLVLNDYRDLVVINDIPFKENIAHYIKCLLPQNKSYKFSDYLSLDTLRFIHTPTDLLRVYAVISNGDQTLRTNTKFISLDRKCRRLFLAKLNSLASYNQYFIDDLARHEFLWKKAFEKLHVGEYKDAYPMIFENARMLRNNDYFTYYGKLDSLKGDQAKYISLLKTRPGEFARRLDYLVRNPNFDLEYTLDAFLEVSSEVSSTLLLQLWEHFNNRDRYDTRIFKINKQYSSVYKEIEDTRNSLDEEVVKEIIVMLEKALTRIYANYESRGKVYLDESLKNYCLPINSRNASSQNKTLTFGSRVKLSEGDGDFLRLFTHFKNMDNKNSKKYDNCRVDVDLSVEFVNSDFTETFSLSWHNLDGGRDFDSYHSGDITSAPKGASEFVDLDYKKARKYARYALVVNSVYTGQDFADIPECFSGAMLMDKMGKRGKIFNPEFIATKFDLTQVGSNQNIAFAIDLETLELIWMDSPKKYGFLGIVAAADGGILLPLKEALKKHMNLYDFFKLHSGHIEFVDKKEDADIIISDDEDATLKPYDVEAISASWL